jgi:hypothetical protein
MSKVKDVFPRMPIGKEGKIKLAEIIGELGKTQTEVENLLSYLTKLYFEKSNTSIITKINRIGLLSKLLEINQTFLQIFISAYESNEPIIFTTLARGIFELHLILREAMSSDENFLKICIQTSSAYESFIQKFIRLAERENKKEALEVFNREIERVISIRKKYEKLFQTDMFRKVNSKINFEDIAKKYNLWEDYDYYYRMLSSFLHPTFLYIITTLPKDRTLSEEQIKLSLWNLEQRKLMIKSIAIIVAFDFSLRTKEHVEKIIEESK